MIDLSHSITMYVNPEKLLSHALCFALKEKAIYVNYSQTKPPQLSPLPRPILNHNNFIVSGIWALLEYIEDRFPDPPLWPRDFSHRAGLRMLVIRIIEEWYPLLENDQHTELAQNINAITSHFEPNRYFCGRNFTFIDCFLVPLLYTFCQENNATELQAPIREYTHRMINRPAFHQTIACRNDLIERALPPVQLA